MATFLSKLTTVFAVCFSSNTKFLGKLSQADFPEYTPQQKVSYTWDKILTQEHGTLQLIIVIIGKKRGIEMAN